MCKFICNTFWQHFVSRRGNRLLCWRDLTSKETQRQPIYSIKTSNLFCFFLQKRTFNRLPLRDTKCCQNETKENEKEILSSFGLSIFLSEDATTY